MRSQLKKTKSRKAAGRDGISSSLLRDCADQLSGGPAYFQPEPAPGEGSGTVEDLSGGSSAKYRMAQRAQPPQTRSPNFPPDEDLGEAHLAPPPPSGEPSAQPLAVSVPGWYRSGGCHHLSAAPSHLSPGAGGAHWEGHVFYSALSTPSSLHCWEGSWREQQLTAWTISYLTSRQQYVRLHDCVSEVVVCSTGAPQGTVLSPFVFSLYTSDFRFNSDHCHIQKSWDDTATSDAPPPAEESKVLRSVLSLLRTFYDSLVASALFYAAVCWGGGRTDRDRRTIDKLVRRSSTVLGCPRDSVDTVVKRRMLAKLTSVMDNSHHPVCLNAYRVCRKCIEHSPMTGSLHFTMTLTVFLPFGSLW